MDIKKLWTGYSGKERLNGVVIVERRKYGQVLVGQTISELMRYGGQIYWLWWERRVTGVVIAGQGRLFMVELGENWIHCSGTSRAGGQFILGQ